MPSETTIVLWWQMLKKNERCTVLKEVGHAVNNPDTCGDLEWYKLAPAIREAIVTQFTPKKDEPTCQN